MLIITAFWSCYDSIYSDEFYNDSLFQFYLITYCVYVLGFFLWIFCYVQDQYVGNTTTEQMGWLRSLYLAGGINIDNINYVKFMHCCPDILYCFMRYAITNSLRNQKLLI